MEGFPIVVRFPVLWGDMDALGHVNNARYFTWFEAARIAYLRELGLATTGVPELGPILAHASCDFLRPVRWPADVAVGARVGKIGRTSFEMHYAVALQSTPDDPFARGRGVVVLIDYSTGEKVAVPDALRARIEALG
jgi:acyl-CoA thioester hydrolase